MVFCYIFIVLVVVFLFLFLILMLVMCGKFLSLKGVVSVFYLLEIVVIGVKKLGCVFDFGKVVGCMFVYLGIILGVCVVMLVSFFFLSGFLEWGFMLDIDEGSFVIDYYVFLGIFLVDID